MCKLIERASSNIAYYNRGFETISANDSNIDTRDLNARKWLNTISAKAYADYEWEERALKKLSKIVTKTRIESGYFVADMFLNISLIRGEITTEVIDGKEMDDFNSNPYDIDYEISPDDILDAMYSEPTWKVCAAVTHDANPACPECKGEGAVRCERCGGSRREQYTEGYFANGEEKIKTGQCPRCYGTGKTQCGKCAGSGKRQLFSKQAQTLKKFKDIKEVLSSVSTFNTFHDYSGSLLDSCIPNYYAPINIFDDSDDFDTIKTKKIIWGVWCDFSNQELKDGIVKLHKNQKEIIIDKKTILPDIIKEYKDLREKFEQSKKYALEKFKENTQGKLGCIIEKHLVVPIFRLWYSTKLDQEERCIEIYETTNKEIYYKFRGSLPELSFWKSLFI
jgi:molecular chaperone DnaJ